MSLIIRQITNFYEEWQRFVFHCMHEKIMCSAYFILLRKRVLSSSNGKLRFIIHFASFLCGGRNKSGKSCCRQTEGTSLKLIIIVSKEQVESSLKTRWTLRSGKLNLSICIGYGFCMQRKLYCLHELWNGILQWKVCTTQKDVLNLSHQQQNSPAQCQ